MFKRVFLFLAMNLAVILVINIVVFILEKFFHINISGYGWSYSSIFIFALIVWFSWSFISLLLSKWMAKRSYNIEIITKDVVHNLSGKELVVYSVVEDLAMRNNIRMPEVWIYEAEEPNAFATGPSKNNSLVAVSTWLLDKMSKDETLQLALTVGIKYKKEKNNEYTHSNLIIVLDKNGVIRLHHQGLDKNFSELLKLVSSLSF